MALPRASEFWEGMTVYRIVNAQVAELLHAKL